MASAVSSFFAALAVYCALAAAQPITSPTAIATVVSQQDDAAVALVALDLDYWTNATLLMADANAAAALANASVAALLAPPAAAAFVAALNVSECVALPAAAYAADATLVQTFACCHLRKLRAPMLVGVLGQAAAALQAATVDADAGLTVAALQGLRDMQAFDAFGFDVCPCLDDRVPCNAGQSLVRATGALVVLAEILEVYENLYYGALALAPCAGANATAAARAGCSGPAPVALANATYGPAFFAVDAAYQDVCGPAPLAALAAAQAAPAC